MCRGELEIGQFVDCHPLCAPSASSQAFMKMGRHEDIGPQVAFANCLPWDNRSQCPADLTEPS